VERIRARRGKQGWRLPETVIRYIAYFYGVLFSAYLLALLYFPLYVFLAQRVANSAARANAALLLAATFGATLALLGVWFFARPVQRMRPWGRLAWMQQAATSTAGRVIMAGAALS